MNMTEYKKLIKDTDEIKLRLALIEKYVKNNFSRRFLPFYYTDFNNHSLYLYSDREEQYYACLFNWCCLPFCLLDNSLISTEITYVTYELIATVADCTEPRVVNSRNEQQIPFKKIQEAFRWKS